jgi:hypothetical protein
MENGFTLFRVLQLSNGTSEIDYATTYQGLPPSWIINRLNEETMGR